MFYGSVRVLGLVLGFQSFQGAAPVSCPLVCSCVGTYTYQNNHAAHIP